MGNFRQHMAFSSTLGVFYSAGAYALAGLDWLYGTVALLLTTLGGLLPDLDSPSAVGLRGFTGILGVLGAVGVWYELGEIDPPPVFELHLWGMIGTYLLIRYGIKHIVGRFTVHRGMSHSVPMLAVWAELAYLYYPSESHFVRVIMAAAVGLGFFSHLLLDEICSVDLLGARVNKAFGTAIKFWAPSIGSTLLVYSVLSFLTFRIIEKWPDDSFPAMSRIKASVERATWPERLPKPAWLGSLFKTPEETGMPPRVLPPTDRSTGPGRIPISDREPPGRRDDPVRTSTTTSRPRRIGPRKAVDR